MQQRGPVARHGCHFIITTSLTLASDDLAKPASLAPSTQYRELYCRANSSGRYDRNGRTNDRTIVYFLHTHIVAPKSIVTKTIDCGCILSRADGSNPPYLLGRIRVPNHPACVRQEEWKGQEGGFLLVLDLRIGPVWIRKTRLIRARQVPAFIDKRHTMSRGKLIFYTLSGLKLMIRSISLGSQPTIRELWRLLSTPSLPITLTDILHHAGFWLS